MIKEYFCKDKLIMFYAKANFFDYKFLYTCKSEVIK